MRGRGNVATAARQREGGEKTEKSDGQIQIYTASVCVYTSYILHTYFLYIFYQSVQPGTHGERGERSPCGVVFVGVGGQAEHRNHSGTLVVDQKLVDRAFKSEHRKLCRREHALQLLRRGSCVAICLL